MKEIFPGIFLITEKGAFGVIKPPLNIYIIAGEQGLIYDAGYGKRNAVKYLIKEINKIKTNYNNQNKDFNLVRIIPSHAHPDHFSGLKKIRDKLDVKVAITQKMAEIVSDKLAFYKSFEDTHEDYFLIQKKRKKESIGIKLRRFITRTFYRRGYGVAYINNPDEIIEENIEFVINNDKWKVLHTPGHSIDHISLYNEKKGILLAGDNILRTKTTWLGPPGSNIQDYLNSLKKIHELPKLEIILPSHGSHIENPKERIEEIISHRNNRTQQVLDMINEFSDIGITLKDIIRNLYPKHSRFMHNVARGWVCLTLKMLEDEKLIRKEISRINREYQFFPMM
ncbi:MAG: MBL fold metallo-hydrolase [Promethearchaeota archaeon]